MSGTSIKTYIFCYINLSWAELLDDPIWSQHANPSNKTGQSSYHFLFFLQKEIVTAECIIIY